MIFNFISENSKNDNICYVLTEKNIPENIPSVISSMIKRGRINFKENKTFIVEEKDKTVIAVSLNSEKSLMDHSSCRDIFADLVRFCKKEDMNKIVLDASNLRADYFFDIAEGMEEGSYTFKQGRERKNDFEADILLKYLTGEMKEKFMEGKRNADVLSFVKDLVNETSSTMIPGKFVEKAKDFLKDKSIEIEVLDEKKLEKQNFKALLEVSRGSFNKPYALLIRYKGDKEHPDDITGLLGKGVTYDTGGLSLKSKKGMLTMHHDMAGAAAVVGAMKLIAMEGCRKNVTGMAVLSENMLSEKAYRPGDIIETMGGKTVLVNSTDAEGRLVLADGLTYLTRKEKVSRVCDIATLTGGVVAALGDKITGYTSNDETLACNLQKAAEKTGDDIWRMPVYEAYREKIKGKQSDLVNSTLGDGPAMMIGALFLSEFINDTPWVHIDCAGTAWGTKEKGRFSFGSTAVGSELMANFVKNL